MTVAIGTPIVTYTGDGATNAYAFPFPVFLQAHLVVAILSSNGSTSYLLTLGTDYMVSGLSPNGSPALSGTITLVNSGQAWLTGANLTTGYIITIQRTMPVAQTTSIRNQGDFYPATLEDALDYIVMILQQTNFQSTIYTDIITGYTYKIVFVNGVMSQQRLT